MVDNTKLDIEAGTLELAFEHSHLNSAKLELKIMDASNFSHSEISTNLRPSNPGTAVSPTLLRPRPIAAVQPNRGALIRARTLPPAQRRKIPMKDCINAFKLPLPHFDCRRRRDYCRREEEVEAGLVL
ncbi:hypothetical protein L484_022778 [Morus notabilis]|uniref:Uncharacterized protein n=1 Tax=Morus notabilis TaxID=981085 RepID=W9SMQ1_9ROSA|nr:hypothetical protein L484_022778 [Morus notabilis]